MEIASQNSVDIIKKFLIKKSKTVKEDSNISPKFDNIYTPRCKQSPKLARLYRPNQQYPRDIELIVYKCRQYGVKSKFLPRLTITNRFPKKLMKDLNISFVIYAAKYQIAIIRSCKHNFE